MAAVFAGAARAPFTAVLIVFEMTDHYRMIVPLMAGVIISMLVATQLHRESIYTLKLARRGIHFNRGRDIDILESVHVEEIMLRDPETVQPETPVPTLVNRFLATGLHGFPVVNKQGELVGVVSLRDYRQAQNRYDDLSDLTVREIMQRNLIVAYPDETVSKALRRMAPRDISRLPVVLRDNPKALVGLIRRNDIIRAYELGATRRDQWTLQQNQNKIRLLSSFDTTEIPVLPGSACDGRPMRQIPWPEKCLVVAIRRETGTIIPHGSEILTPGDTLLVISAPDALETVRSLCSQPPAKASDPASASGNAQS